MRKRGFPKLLVIQRGVVAVLMALLLPAIAGMMALVVDVSHSWETRRLLQNCSDAAALAGAREEPNAALAEAVARTYLANCLDAAEAAAADVDPFIDRNSDGVPDTVAVTSRRDVWFTFARVLGHTDPQTIGASAVAGAITPDAFYGLEPFGVQVDQDNPPTDCRQPLEYYSIQGVTIVPGASYTIKYSAGNDNGVSGNFQPLALGGRGKNVYKDNVLDGYPEAAYICSQFDTEPGNAAGPTFQALEARLVPLPQWCTDTSPRWSECPWVFLVALVPPLPPGRDEVTILTFAFFVVDSYQQPDTNKAEITGRFFDTTNMDLPGGQWVGNQACDPTLGLPCGVKLLE